MIDGRTRVFAILGSPVEHSLSPVMHNAAFRVLGLEAVYVPLRCDSAEVGAAMRLLALAGGGGNLTVPHKEVGASCLDEPSERVRRLGACNTFWYSGSRLAGDNTDVDGVLAALDLLEAPASTWLVAGTGGGARAAVAAARERSARVAVRSRDMSRKRAFEEWVRQQGVAVASLKECEVLINATPLGLHASDHLPIALDDAPDASVAFDMVYARQETVWVRNMRQSGLRASDGREMLVAQGAAAFRHWFPDEDPPVEVMRAAVSDALR